MLVVMSWRRRSSIWVPPLLLGGLLYEISRHSSLMEAAGASEFTATYLANRDAFCLSLMSPFVRALAVAAVLVVWQLAVRAVRRRMPGHNVWQVTVWSCALTLALATFIQAKTSNRAIQRNLREVLEIAKRDEGRTPFAGAFSTPWSGITASGRFAVYSGGCTGIYDLAWGYVVQDGPFIKRVYEETGPMASGKYQGVQRFLIAEDQRFQERGWATMVDLQQVLTDEKHPIDAPFKWLPQYDSNTLAIARTHLAEFLRHEPVHARIINIRPIPHRWLSLTEAEYEGGLDHGRDVGLVPGIALCPSSGKQEWGVLIAAVSERQSTFISVPSAQPLHAGMELTSSCGPR